MGESPLRKGVPCSAAGRKPLLQITAPRPPPAAPTPVGSTTKAGRSGLAEPRPYCTQEPSAGRPGTRPAVCSFSDAMTWVLPSVLLPFRKAMSSTCLAILGSRSDTQAPLSPCCFQVRLLA